MKLSEIIKSTKGSTKENIRDRELLEEYGDVDIENQQYRYWMTEHIFINGEYVPLCFERIVNHSSVLVKYTDCSQKDWDRIFNAICYGGVDELEFKKWSGAY